MNGIVVMSTDDGQQMQQVGFYDAAAKCLRYRLLDHMLVVDHVRMLELSEGTRSSADR